MVFIFCSAMPQSKFFLRCVLSRFPDINLPDGVEIIVGRNVLTKIKDFRLSRKHASLIANESEGKIEVKQLGSNLSFCSKKNSDEGKLCVSLCLPFYFQNQIF